MIRDLDPSPSALDLLELIGDDVRQGALWQLAVKHLVKEILEYLADDE